MTEKSSKLIHFKIRPTYNKLIVIALVVAIITTVVISLNSGYIKLSLIDILNALSGSAEYKKTFIIMNLRMPRIVLSILVGASLALAGCIIQNITKNNLADPGLLGINAGAGLAVVIYVIFFGSESFLSVFTLPFLSLIGGGVTAVLIYCLAFRKKSQNSSFNLVLIGVAVQAGITALTTLLVVKLDETQFDFVTSWQAGSIWGSNWKFVLALIPWVVILIPYVVFKAKILDIMNLSREITIGLGVEVEKERTRLIAVAVALASSSVSVSGSISFVGLIAPHIAKKLVGPKHNILIPTSALTGALLVTLADTFGRVALQPTEVPTGIMVAIIGAPYLIFLLMKGR